MTSQDILSFVLLSLSVVVVVASSVGLLVMPDVYQKLHFVGPATVVAPVLVGLAVLAHEGFTAATTETWLVVLFLVSTGPCLAHATARAARIRNTDRRCERRDRTSSQETVS